MFGPVLSSAVTVTDIGQGTDEFHYGRPESKGLKAITKLGY
jgi:hypothetical protein